MKYRDNPEDVKEKYTRIDICKLLVLCAWFVKQAVKTKRGVRTGKRPRQFKAHNDHLGGVLEDYSEKLDK